MKKEELAFLISFIENQWQIISQIKENLQKKKEVKTYEDTIVTGFLLHNLYNAMEDILKEVVQVFENRIEDTSQYHAELIKRMRLDIVGIRPRFVSNKSFKILTELRGFRHVFRHVYDYELDSQKVKNLTEITLNSFESFEKDKEDFLKFLKENIQK